MSVKFFQEYQQRRSLTRKYNPSLPLSYKQAHLWLAEEYPLKLQEQVMPIVDLMAITSTHFAKLKHFIQMQLPSGFPVKIGGCIRQCSGLRKVFLFIPRLVNELIPCWVD